MMPTIRLVVDRLRAPEFAPQVAELLALSPMEAEMFLGILVDKYTKKMNLVPDAYRRQDLQQALRDLWLP